MVKSLRIFVCGRLALENGGSVLREADFPARQGRRLWAYLVCRRRLPVARDELAEAVWGDEIPDAWDAALNALVSRLRACLRRSAVAPSALAIRSDIGRYALELSSGAFVDLERARSAQHVADTLMRQGRAGAALAEARVAMEIAGRGFLPGEEAPWIQGVRRELHEIHLHAREGTVEGELSRGHCDLAEREAAQLVAYDPLREEGYRLLMRALAARGNKAAATLVMEECRRVLRGQAGLTPSAETERVFRSVTHG